MPAPRQCTLPTPCDRGYGPMRGCGLCRGNVHGGVVHARGGVALWRGWGIPLKGAALGSCQTRPSGDIRLPAPKKTTMELGLPEKNWRWTRTVHLVGCLRSIDGGGNPQKRWSRRRPTTGNRTPTPGGC